METPSVTGAHILAALIQNAFTYDAKTAYSKAKYVRRK